jgi:glycyl-tRNA synthetase alpha chain
LLFRLQAFWAARGCVIQQPYDVEVGAGTMASGDVFARAGAQALQRGLRAALARPADGRYGENPNRLFKHTQFQLILKPPPVNVQELYLESLEAIGIDLATTTSSLKRTTGSGRRAARGAWVGR